jgi:hypothetical protein
MITYRDKLMFLHGVAFTAVRIECPDCRGRLVDEVASALFLPTHGAGMKADCDELWQLLKEGGFFQDLAGCGKSPKIVD